MKTLSKGFALGTALGLLLMLGAAVAINNTVLQKATVDNTAVSFTGLLDIRNLDGSSIGAVAGHSWGGFACYQTKNWTVEVTNVGQDVLNLAWAVTGLDTTTWALQTTYSDSLNGSQSLFPATDLNALNTTGTTTTVSTSGSTFTATIPAYASYVVVNYYFDSGSGSLTLSEFNVSVTPTSSMHGSTFYVSDLTLSSFRINISPVDSVAHTFTWQVTCPAALNFMAYPQPQSVTSSSPQEPYTVTLDVGQTVYVCFELEEIQQTLTTASFQLQILSII